jgi:hypothetical protein
MIPSDIEARSMKRISQEGQIFGRQVPTGENQVDPGESFGVELRKKERFDTI